jgi:hypothetical protein
MRVLNPFPLPRPCGYSSGDNITDSIPVPLLPAPLLIPSLHLRIFPPPILLSSQGGDPLFLLLARWRDNAAGSCTDDQLM